MKFTFTDRISYLAWRQEWKHDYAQLSNDIRGLKRGRKQYLRTYKTTVTPQGKVRHKDTEIANPLFDGTGTGQSRLVGLQREAIAQLEILVEAKALSYALKLARLAQEGVIVSPGIPAPAAA